MNLIDDRMTSQIPEVKRVLLVFIQKPLACADIADPDVLVDLAQSMSIERRVTWILDQPINFVHDNSLHLRSKSLPGSLEFIGGNDLYLHMSLPFCFYGEYMHNNLLSETNRYLRAGYS